MVITSEMTDEQNSKDEKRSRSFGDIPILPEEDSGLNKAVRRKTRPAHPERQRPGRPTPPSTNRSGTTKKRTVPYLALLCVPVAVFLIYLAGAYYLVPLLIKGPLATHLSQQLNRPVSAADVSFAPLSFRLHLAGITVGPDSSRKNDHELCRVAMINGRLQPTSLLQGKVVLEDVEVDRPMATLVRYQDNGYNFFSAGLIGEKNNDNLDILPPWLFIQGLQLTDGTMIFHDLPAGREHRIEQIQLIVPADDGLEKIGGEPTLSAVVNSSPILIRGQRFATADGGRETKLSLQLKELDLQQYLAYLPGAATSLTITNGTTDAELYLTFRNNRRPGSKLTMTGKITTSDLVAQDNNKNFQLKISAAQMLLRAKPLQRLYTIEEFVMVAPQATLTNKQPSGPMNIHSRLVSLLKQTDFGLEIDRLQVDNGSLENDGRKGFHDLHILLTGFRNQTAAKSRSTTSNSAQLTFTASSGDAAIGFQGQLEPSLALTGNISLRDMDTDMLQSYLPATEGIRFSRGKVEFEGTLLTRQEQGKPPAWQITDSTLQIHDFSLHKEDSLLLKGQEISGRKCSVQGDNHHISCRRLIFDNTYFDDAATALLLADKQEAIDKWLPVSFNNLTITNATALIPLPQTGKNETAPRIELSNLQLNLTGLNQEQQDSDNLTVKAAAGGKGKVELSGRMQSNGRGLVQVSATDIDIAPLTPLFSSWFALPVNQGKLQLKGSIQLPANKFIGSFQLDNFSAETRDGPAVRWPQASGAGVTAGLTPFSAAINELSIQQPAFRFPPGDSSLPSGFLKFFKHENNAPTLPPVKIERCTISGGNMQRQPAPSGNQQLTGFTRVEGTLTPLQPAAQSAFMLSGRMNAADFTVTGSTGINSSDNYELEVNRFSLAPFTPMFSKSPAINVQRASADWHFSSPPNDSGLIQLTGIVPMPGSDLSLTLALLTDKNGSFILPVSPEAAGNPDHLLEQGVIARLRQLRLQAVISPRLVLDKFLPDLNLPREIEFLAGESVPDFMEGLEDYAALLERRPRIGLIIRGNYDEKTDRQYLLQVLQEAADAQRELENLGREELRTRLLADEEQHLADMAKQGLPANREKLQQIEQQPDLQPLPQETVQLPVNTLQNLARQRAEATRSYFTNQLRLPADRIKIKEGIAGGTKADLSLIPLW